MTSKNILKIGVSLFLLIGFIGVLFSLGLDPSDIGSAKFHYKKILQSILVFLCIWLVRRLIELICWHPYEKKRGVHPPHLFITLQNAVLFIIAVFIVIKGVFNQPLASIITMGGLVTAGLAFALKEIIYDVCSGLILDIERPYKVGDWVKVDNIEGKIFRIGWRATVIATSDQQHVLVPNGFFLKETFINYNKPEDWYWQTLEISIGHDVPVDRARRLLHAALHSATDLHDNLCNVYAYQPTERGITYDVRYAVKSHEHWRETRHQVIEAITHYLYAHGLNISTLLGEYNLSRGGKPLKFKMPYSALETIQHTSLFKALPLEVLSEIADKAERIQVRAGEIIVEQGDTTTSLYIIIEGAAQVVAKYEDKTTETLSTLKARDYFGEYSLLLQAPRSATVVSKTDCLLIEINKEIMHEIFQNFPHVAEGLSEVMAKNITQLQLRKQQHISQDKKNLKQEILDEIKNIFKLA